MAILEYELGGSEYKLDAGEAICQILENRTLLVEQLTSNEPINPQIVQGLRSIEDVFVHYNPSVLLDFVLEDGCEVSENLSFTKIKDFDIEEITTRSKCLRKLREDYLFFNTFLKHLNNNRLLIKIIESEEGRNALISYLEEIKSNM